MSTLSLALLYQRCCLVIVVLVVAASQAKDVANCSCGYYDPNTKEFFTDSSIVYFNETDRLPTEVFEPEVFENKYEKGWNSRYRQSAQVSNIALSTDQDGQSTNTSLQLYVNPSTSDHLVVGGSVQTVRRDIFYGSFRALIRSPRAWLPGSAVSMNLYYNDSQTINLDIMNPTEATAWVAMLSHEEFPDRKLGVDYSVLSNSTNAISPWDYTEYRIDWTEEKVTYSIGGKPFRSILRAKEKSFPVTPSVLRFKHWSVGNWFTMQGPPSNRSAASIYWTRMFFNSSLATEQDHQAFYARCQSQPVCTTEDMELRGSSPYTTESTVDWVQAFNPPGSRVVPKVLMIITGSISTLLILNAVARRVPWNVMTVSKLKTLTIEKLKYPRRRKSVGFTSEDALASQAPGGGNRVLSYLGSRAASFNRLSNRLSLLTNTPPNVSIGPYIHLQMDDARFSALGNDGPKKPRISWREFNASVHQTRQGRVSLPGEAINESNDDAVSIVSIEGSRHSSSSAEIQIIGNDFHGRPTFTTSSGSGRGILRSYAASEVASHSAMGSTSTVNTYYSLSGEETTPVIPSLPVIKSKVDFLAGLVAFSCLGVTLIHFVLTFSPAFVDPGADVHYGLETWMRKIASGFLLNLVWIGPFLITSTKFLTINYLRHGDLLEIARKAVGRPFRLILPVFGIAMLEYFFMDSGATNWLEYLPSVTWSTWPFATVPNNFGYFISEILELAYLIPNAAPQITFNYCTGVLWTIPVQLQGSWVALLGVVVIRSIKNPWKRFGYYSFCILMNWYALSWGSYFYFGIMLTDLEVTYNYRKWLYARPVAYYPLIVLLLFMTFGGLTVDMATQLSQVNYASYEHGIHPDIPTGLPIMFTGAKGYPQYYVPKLNGIVFAFGLQALVEISPAAQRIFSCRPLMCIFPHINTIYLVHGFIFWSLGSTVCIYLLSHHFRYWQMVLIVFVCCYAALFLSLYILSPIVNTLGNADHVWMLAHETPSPRKPTLYPFPTNFLYSRQEYAQEVLAEAETNEAPALASKNRSRLTKFVLGLAATINPELSNQPCQPVSVSVPSGNSISGPSIPARSVGWRTGGFSKSVLMLKRNNVSRSCRKG